MFVYCGSGTVNSAGTVPGIYNLTNWVLVKYLLLLYNRGLDFENHKACVFDISLFDFSTYNWF